MRKQLYFVWVVALIELCGSEVPCSSLFAGSLCCADPEVDSNTQQFVTCQPNHTATITCYPYPGVRCDGRVQVSLGEGTRAEAAALGPDVDWCNGELYNRSEALTVSQTTPCCYVDPNKQFDFSTALGLSVFLGMFGVDRFYLGYPAIGLMKLCTFGGCLVGQLVDIVLIAAQIVGPADGSCYKTDFFGPRLCRRLADEETFVT